MLIVAYYFPPQNTAGSARPHRFYKYLPEFGYDPRVITSAVPDESPRLTNVCRTTLAPSSAGEVMGSYLGRLGQRLSRRYSDRLPWIPLALSTAEKAVTRKSRIVLSTHPPLCTHLAGLEIKRRHRLKWVADFRDPIYPPNTQSAKLFPEWAERVIFREADWIVANTDTAAEMWRKRYPQYGRKISTIWNGYDPQEQITPLPLPEHSFRYLTHAGDIYGPRHPARLLASISRLVAAGRISASQFRLRLLGTVEAGSPFLGIPEFAELKNAGVLECDGKLVPRATALRAIGESDHLVLLDNWSLERNVQVPSKIFDYIRIGRPILAFTTPDSPAERILRQSGVTHECIYAGDDEIAVDRKVFALLQQPPVAKPVNSWFVQTFDGRAQTESLSHILDSLLDR